jgi:aspartate/methionine/tyrosine aminotransferase
MTIRDFALERFFAKHEFAARHVLGASDVEGMRMSDLLALADDEAAQRWATLTLGYTESAGLPALRGEIAAMYDGLDADDVLTFSGAEEGIYLTMHATLQAGDHVVAVWPAYQSLYEVARSIGADVTPVPLDARDWSLDMERLAAAMRPATRMVVINFPHNPTGAHIEASQLDAIVRLCRDRGAMLFSDEVYRFLEHEPRALLPPAAARYERAISLGVMSKSFALAGLRVGWIATRDRGLLSRIARLKDYTTICGSAPSEILALIALRARDQVLQRSNEIVRRNLPALHAFMSRHAAHLAWVPPMAGSVCFPRFTADVDAERAAELFSERAGVLVLPGVLFDFDRAHFRIGFGRHDTAEALALIDPLIPQAVRS